MTEKSHWADKASSGIEWTVRLGTPVVGYMLGESDDVSLAIYPDFLEVGGLLLGSFVLHGALSAFRNGRGKSSADEPWYLSFLKGGTTYGVLGLGLGAGLEYVLDFTPLG